MNLLSKKIVSFLFVASLLFANGLAMMEKKRGLTLEEQLLWACEEGDLGKVKGLLKKNPGIDVNKGSKNGKTPLHVACFNGHTEVVKELLKHKDIDVNKGDKGCVYYVGWMTPLHFACDRGCTEIVDEDGWTPLYADCYKGRTEVVELLLAFGANLRIRNNEGETVLDIAQGKNSWQVIRALENPLVTAVRNLGLRGVEVYIKMDIFDLYKKYEYKIGEETRNYFRIHIAESVLQKFEDGLTKPFLAKEKEIELRQNVEDVKKIINLLKTLLSSLKDNLKKVRDGGVFCDCVVLTFL